MIVLDFQLEPPNSRDFSERTPEHILSFIGVSYFLGDQTFVVNGVNFSMRLPLLWFAWHLRRVAQWVRVGNEPYRFLYIDEDWALTFSKKDALIEIVETGHNYEVRLPLKIASIAPDELVLPIKRHYRRVYKACSRQYPTIMTNQRFHQWLYEDYVPPLEAAKETTER